MTHDRMINGCEAQRITISFQVVDNVLYKLFISSAMTAKRFTYGDMKFLRLLP